MKLQFSAEDELFRAEFSAWLADNLTGEFEKIRYRGGPGDEHMYPSERHQWEKKMAAGGWTCIGWPEAYGGKDASI